MEQRSNKIKIIVTLLLASTMTIMAGATIAPSLPQITETFKDVTNAKLLTKLILTIPGLFIAVISPVAGHIIDTYGRKKLLLFSLMLYAISGTSGLYFNNLYAILAGRAILGFSVAGIMATATTLIADYFDAEERNRIIGFQGSFMAFGGVIYILAGGYLADMNWRYPFGIYILSFFVFVLGALFLYEPEFDRKSGNTDISDDGGVNTKTILLIYLIAFSGMALFYMIPTQIPYILGEKGYVNAQTGIAISASTLTAGLISFYYRKIKSRFTFQGIYAFTFLAMGVGYILISRSESFGFFIFSLVICGLGTGLLMPNANLWLINLAPFKQRGRIISLLGSSVFLGQFLSPVLVMPLLNNMSSQQSFFVVSFIMLVVSMIFFVSSMRIKKEKDQNGNQSK